MRRKIRFGNFAETLGMYSDKTEMAWQQTQWAKNSAINNVRTTYEWLHDYLKG